MSWRSRLALRTRLLFVVLMLALLPACDGPLSLLTGGGPNVAANVQAGQTNTQGVSYTSEAPRVTVRPRSRVDTIDQSTTNHIEMPPWVLLVIVVLAAGGAIGWIDNITRLWRK